MAKVQCKVSWEAGKVVWNYTLLAVEPSDVIDFVTSDKDPFIIECPDERLARRLGLNTGPTRTPIAGRSDLYPVAPANGATKERATSGTSGTSGTNSDAVVFWGTPKELKCGTLNGDTYKPWPGSGSGVMFPDDGN